MLLHLHTERKAKIMRNQKKNEKKITLSIVHDRMFMIEC